nr:immunoglobulin heavy chain junction region [Mus musculus]
ISVRDTGVT